VKDCAEELAKLGGIAAGLGLRLSSHPGQYIVLNSEDPAVRTSAVRDLELQAELFDAMGLPPESVVVLHVGGAAGGTRAAMDRFEAGFAELSDAARARLVIENDDRSFGVNDVLGLSERIAVEERSRRVGRRVERSLVLPQLRAHADLIDPIGFEHFLLETAAGLDFDVMLEAKAKDLALLRLREQLAARGVEPALGV